MNRSASSRSGARGGAQHQKLDLKRNLWPIACGLSAAGLCFVLSWVQVKSKDTLPEYLQGPAIVGAVAAGCSVVTSIACAIALAKGRTYIFKIDQGSAPTRRKQHPVWTMKLRNVHSVIGGLMLIFASSYVYMTTWVVAYGVEGDTSGRKYCLTMSGDACTGDSTAWLVCLGLLLAVAALSQALMENVIIEAELEFADRHPVNGSSVARRASMQSSRRNSMINPQDPPSDFSDADDYDLDKRRYP